MALRSIVVVRTDAGCGIVSLGMTTAVLAEAAARAPRAAGVYFFLGSDGELCYVGKASELRRRLADHARAAGAPTDGRWAVLLDAVEAVHWETCDDEDAALIREADLIVMLRPSFNASHAEQDPRCYIIVTDASSALCRTAAGPGRAYGTFPHLAQGAYSRPAKRTKAGYAALLRLLAAGSADAELPAPVHDFLSGRSVRLLGVLQDNIAASAVDEYERRALARDDIAAREFYELGPVRLRRFRLRHGLPVGPVPAEVMASLLASEVREVIGEFHVAGAAGDAVPGRHANRSRELRARLAGS